jgi:hypothetical protein
VLQLLPRLVKALTCARQVRTFSGNAGWCQPGACGPGVSCRRRAPSQTAAPTPVPWRAVAGWVSPARVRAPALRGRLSQGCTPCCPRLYQGECYAARHRLRHHPHRRGGGRSGELSRGQFSDGCGRYPGLVSFPDHGAWRRTPVRAGRCVSPRRPRLGVAPLLQAAVGYAGARGAAASGPRCGHRSGTAHGFSGAVAVRPRHSLEPAPHPAGAPGGRDCRARECQQQPALPDVRGLPPRRLSGPRAAQ